MLTGQGLVCADELRSVFERASMKPIEEQLPPLRALHTLLETIALASSYLNVPASKFAHFARSLLLRVTIELAKSINNHAIN